MTASHPLIRALAGVSFAPGTVSKRFVQNMAARPADYELSERAESWAWRIAYHMRRQLPKDLAAEAVARKIDHKWEPSFTTVKCSVCLTVLHSERERNAPCSGPPKPSSPRGNKSQPVVVATVLVASLFDGEGM